MVEVLYKINFYCKSFNCYSWSMFLLFPRIKTWHEMWDCFCTSSNWPVLLDVSTAESTARIIICHNLGLSFDGIL